MAADLFFNITKREELQTILWEENLMSQSRGGLWTNQMQSLGDEVVVGAKCPYCQLNYFHKIASSGRLKDRKDIHIISIH